MSICVLGAGINGLSTARQIQQRDPRVKVHIIASKISPRTTSDKAAGFWFPFCLPDKREKLITRWAAATFNHIDDLYHFDALRYGIGAMSGFDIKTIGNKNEGPFYWKKHVQQYRQLTDEDVKRFDMPDNVDPDESYFLTSYYTETSLYLRELQKEFLAAGGVLEQRRLRSMQELQGRGFDVIVNCAGLGAMHLFKDEKCYPVRGQILRVRAPFLKHFYMIDNHHYILLNHELTTLGGTQQKGDWDTTPRQSDTDDIMKVVTRYVPSLRTAPVEGTYVGLRPGRDEIRWELEPSYRIGDRTVPVLHNYGHGGSGITLFYGCAQDTASLALDALKTRNFKAKI